METVFGPEWIVQGLLVFGALGLFFALVLILGDVCRSRSSAGRQPIGLRYEPANLSAGPEALERRRLTAFPAAVQLFLAGDGQ